MKAKAIESVYPLSPMQQGILFHSVYESEPTMYFVQYCYTLVGTLNVSAFRRAWQRVIERHPVLRTAFVWEGLDHPLQVVGKKVNLPFEYLDWRNLSSEEQQTKLEALFLSDRSRGFDLSRAPLMRLCLIQLADRTCKFIWSFHHILIDGWSLPLIFKDLFMFYDAFCRGQKLNPDPSRPYQDYIAWLQQQDLWAAEGFWRKMLQRFIEPTPLGVDRGSDQPVDPAERYADQEITVPASVTTALQKMARRHHLTMNTLMQGAWALLLSRYSGQEEVVFGTVVSGRPSDLEGVENIVGLFVNTLPVRVRFPSSSLLEDCLEALQLDQIEARQYDYCPLAQIQGWSDVERGLPLFETILAFENFPIQDLQEEIGGEIKIQGKAVFGPTNYPICVAIDPGPELLIGLSYDRQRFDDATIARLLGHFRTLLENISLDPGCRVSDLQLLTESEERRLLVECNDTQAPYPDHKGVHQLFEEQAERAPEAVAVICGDRSLSYGELNGRANQVAHYLQTLHVGPGSVVAMGIQRSPEMVIGLLGILKAGGAYLPLDLTAPAQRLGYMLEEARTPVLLTLQRQIKSLPRHQATVICLDRDWEVIDRHSRDNRVSQIAADNLAYVIYTSGSTGYPKGVMVAHRGLVNYLTWCIEAYHVGRGQGSVVHSPLCFDLTVTSLLAPLVSGRRVQLLPEEVDFEALATAFEGESRLSLLKLTPVHLDLLSQYLSDKVMAGRVGALVIGGEALRGEHLSFWRRRAPSTRLINEYGPTETVVGSCVYEVADGEIVSGAVPIGRPIANTRIYLLDSNMQPVPIGFAGEIYIAGAGLARGYTNRPDLTAERFLPDPFGGGRLYKTGDLGRYMPDGNLEFLGRIDHQVKIRGYRIEPGEIEEMLGRHPAVREAVVVVREGGDSRDKRLVAYVVAYPDRSPQIGELQDYLRAKLPEYMVPPAFVMLDHLPLTTNGKLDRRALPDPDQSRPRLKKGYVAPRTSVEKMVAEIWVEVLGLEQVGLHDSFFELGGDSILAIQIASRAKQAGFHLTPKDIFERRTIAQLADGIEAVSKPRAEQGPVVGPVPLTPIQRWFFEQDLPEPHHFNQANLLTVDRTINAAILEKSVAELISHHDALRLRFIREVDGWRQYNAAPDPAVPFAEIDFSHLADRELRAAIEAKSAEIEASLNLSEGPIIRVVLMNLGRQRGSRLLIVIHHLAVDIVSWGIVLEDLATACEQLSRGEEVDLPAKTTSFKQWAERLEERARSEELERAAEYWEREKIREIKSVPMDWEGGENSEDSGQTITVELGEEETRKLMHEVPGAYRVQVSEVMLAAMGEALRRWTGEGTVIVDVEGHGREESEVEGVDLTRTVGWFTSIYPVTIGGGESEQERLKRVKEAMRRAPGGGIAYGMLRYLGREAVIGRLRNLPQAQVSFNYLGQFDQTFNQVFSETSILTTAEESAGREISLQGQRRYLLDVAGGVSEGRLRIMWSYSENIHRRSTIEALAQSYLSALRSIIDVCLSPEAVGYTPSDFPLARLDQRRLDELAKADRHIEDIYPLSPMQREMFLHTLSMPESQLGFVQLCWTVGADFQPSTFERAWQQVIDRHPILRTSVYWENLSEPLQIVHQRVTLQWEEHDWRQQPFEQQRRLETFLEEDQRRGFELSKAPLMRLILIRCSDDSSQFIWSYHHLALDGWSLPLVINEALTLYNASLDGEELHLERSRPYRDYMNWLSRQDATRAESFWREMLKGFTSPTPLFEGLPAVDETSVAKYGELEISLSEATTAALESLTRRHQLTPNTIVQGAWALMLSRYTGCRDVVFGITVSGRPAELAGVESMIGLFINILPVRAEVPPDAKLTDWLEALQTRQVELRQYEYIPRSQVQAWSEVPLSRPLFESVVVYENYPLDKVSLLDNIGSLEFKLHNHFGTRASTPITLVAMPGPELQLRIAYDCQRFDARTIAEMLGHLKTLLGDFAADSERYLSEYSLLTQSERRSLLEWSRTQVKSVLDQLNGDQEAASIRDHLAGGRIYILGSDLEMTPVGVPGELYMSCQAPLCPHENSIPDPYGDEPDSCLYKTGTAARYLPEGRIELLGRNGALAMVRGHRIKLEEIEAAMLQHPAVSDVAVIARQDRLVAYVASDRLSDLSIQQLRPFLKARVPDYMLPSDFVTLPALPRTPDGKVEHSSLPEPDFAHSFAKVLLVGDIAPHDILEYQLAGVWEDVFDIRPISPTDNFFDLGGTSMLALSLVSEIHKKLSIDLPLSVLFKGATIRELGEILRKRNGSFSWSPLVPIQTGGSKEPFFCVHAAGGNVLGFVDLARHLDPDQPFFGLQSIGLDGKQEPCTRVEDMAACFIEEIRSVQPHGPYRIGGLSFGGIVAFEMGRQLHAGGQEVALLALLDTWSPIFEGRMFFPELLPADNFDLLSFVSKDVRGLLEKNPSLKEMNLNQQIDFVLDQIGGPDSFGGISKDYVRRVTKIHLNSARAVRDYVPQLYPGRLTVFRAVEAGPKSHYVILHPALGKPEIMSGWSELTSEPLQIFEVPGDHITMITEPQVRVMAERLNACLDQSRHA